jgi:hypothetical protein
MKNILATLMLLTSFATFCNGQNEPQIKGYRTFISAFKATEAGITYQSNKTRIEDLADKIKASNLTSAQKEELASSYKKIVSGSQRMYNELVSDLKSRPRRKQIVTTPTPYLDSLKSKIANINALCADFETSYSAAVSSTKDGGATIVIIVKEIILPLAIEFINEVLVPQAIQKYADRYLQPYIVFKPW